MSMQYDEDGEVGIRCSGRIESAVSCWAQVEVLQLTLTRTHSGFAKKGSEVKYEVKSN